MPGAIIAIDQDRPGPTVSYGSPGVARNDLWNGRQVNPRCTTGGNTSFLWTLLSKPPGSATTLSSTNLVATSFNPDLGGSYRLELQTNGGGPGNVQILILAVKFDNNGVRINRGWRLPALGEAALENNFLGQLRGWAEALENILNDVLAALGGDVVPLSAAASINKYDQRVYLSGLTGNIVLPLPASPDLGERHRFIDTDNSLATWTATIDGNGKNINATATHIMNTGRAVFEVEYTGVRWSIIS